MRIILPGDAPPWAHRLGKSVEDAIRGAHDAPLRLEDLVTTKLPSAADNPYGLVYDTTVNRLKVSNGTSWVGGLGSHATGWTAATGTATRTTFDTATVTTALLAQRVKALIDDLIAKDVIGA